jgi:hypothetical protein
MEDDRVAILEAQLSQAKLIAEEADKKYEEVRPIFFVLQNYYFEGMPIASECEGDEGQLRSIFCFPGASILLSTGHQFAETDNNNF